MTEVLVELADCEEDNRKHEWRNIRRRFKDEYGEFTLRQCKICKRIDYE